MQGTTGFWCLMKPDNWLSSIIKCASSLPQKTKSPWLSVTPPPKKNPVFWVLGARKCAWILTHQYMTMVHYCSPKKPKILNSSFPTLCVSLCPSSIPVEAVQFFVQKFMTGTPSNGDLVKLKLFLCCWSKHASYYLMLHTVLVKMRKAQLDKLTVQC